MKIFPANFTSEKNRTTGASPVWILECPFATGTVYLSDSAFNIPRWGGSSWDFTDGTAHGWTASGANIALLGPGAIRLDSTGIDPQFLSPATSFNGSQQTIVEITIVRYGGSAWDGTCYYATGGHGYSANYSKNIPDPHLAMGQGATITFDMSNLTAGGNDWISNLITSIRIDLGASAADSFFIYSVKVYGAIATLPWIHDWGKIDENISTALAAAQISDWAPNAAIVRSATASIMDILWNPANSPETTDCTLYQWFDDLDASTDPPQPHSMWNIVDWQEEDELIASLRCCNVGVRLDKNVGTRLDNVTFPRAHPNDIGKTIPVPIGAGINTPALRIDWGSRTSLVANIDGVQITAIQLSDKTGYPASGAIWVDQEQISYTSIGSDGTLGGAVARGAAGTTATLHSAGAEVWSVQANYDSAVAPFQCKNIGDIFAQVQGMRLKVVSGISAVYEGGLQKLRATQAILTRVTDENIALAASRSTMTRYPYGFTTSASPLACDGNAATSDILPNGSSAEYYYPPVNFGTIIEQTFYFNLTSTGCTATLNAPGASLGISVPSGTGMIFKLVVTGGNWGDYGQIVKTSTGNLNVLETYKEVLYAPIGSSSTDTRRPATFSGAATFQAIDGDLTTGYRGGPTLDTFYFPATAFPEAIVEQVFYFQLQNEVGTDKYVTLTGGGVSMTVYVTGSTPQIFKVYKAGGAWTDGMTLQRTSGSGNFTVLEVWKTVTYSTSMLSGSTIATRFVDYFSAVVDGAMDDGIGTITGTPNALIERPDFVLKWLYNTFAFWPVANWDTTSAAAAFAENGFKFAGLVADYPKLNDLAAKLAWQCQCYFRITFKAQLIWRVLNAAAIKVIPSTQIRMQPSPSNRTTLKLTRSRLDQVINKISLLYNRDWTNTAANPYKSCPPPIFDGTLSPKTGSIGAYGECEQPDLFKFDFVTLDAMATALGNFYLAYYKDRHAIATFECFLDNSELEFADWVQIQGAGLSELTEVNATPGSGRDMTNDTIAFTARVAVLQRIGGWGSAWGDQW